MLELAYFFCVGFLAALATSIILSTRHRRAMREKDERCIEAINQAMRSFKKREDAIFRRG